MKQIAEDYVSYKTAVLLKEKGFDEPCIGFYNPIDGCFFESCIRKSWDYNRHGSINAPTHQMVLKWLREVHKLSIEPYYDEVLTWVVDIKHIGKHTDMREFEIVRENCYKTYEEAVEAAILYVLKNLI